MRGDSPRRVQSGREGAEAHTVDRDDLEVAARPVGVGGNGHYEDV